MCAGNQLELYLIIFRLSSNKTFQVCWGLVLGQAMAYLFKHTVCSISQVFLSGQIFAPHCNGPANITLTIKISLCLFHSPTQADVKSIPSGSKSLIGFTCLINLKDGQSITKMKHRDSVRYKHVGYTEDTGIFIEKGRCFYSANKHYAST